MNELPEWVQTAAPPVDQWADFFFGLSQQQRFVLLLVAIGCLTGIICTIAGCLASTIASTQRTRAEADLKLEMIEQGMSAEEIARVVEAAPPKDFLERWAHSHGKFRKRNRC